VAVEEGKVNGVVLGVEGLLVSVSDPDVHLRLFRDAVGMTVLAEEALSESDVDRLWGLAGSRADSWLLGVDPRGAAAGIGVHLVRFDPQSPIAVREGATGTDSDALKVCDFMVSDFEGARTRMEGAGFPLTSDPATYDVPGVGRFTEGHIDGPDGIKIALLKSHDADRGRFCRDVDSLFSEVLGFSAPISDPTPVARFYEALGLNEVFRYEIESAGFETMVGIAQATKAVGINYGLSEIDPMLGTIDYGLAKQHYSSLRDRAELPNRGFLAVRLAVSSVDAVAATAERWGLEVAAGPSRARMAPWGSVGSIVLRAPHGVLHHCIEKHRGSG